MRLPFRIEFHVCNCKSRTLVASVSMAVVTQEAHDSGVNWLSLTHDKCLSTKDPSCSGQSSCGFTGGGEVPLHERTP